jgi:hypothetical protein
VIEKYIVCWAGIDSLKTAKVYVTQDEREIELLGNEWCAADVLGAEDLRDVPQAACLLIYNISRGSDVKGFESKEACRRLTFEAIPKFATRCLSDRKPWEGARKKREPRDPNAPKPEGKKPLGIGLFVEEMIVAGRTNAEIRDALAKEERFKDAALVKRPKNISWYRTQIKKREKADA